MADFAPELKRLLRKAGCTFDRQGKGDHEIRSSSRSGINFVVDAKIKSQRRSQHDLPRRSPWDEAGSAKHQTRRTKHYAQSTKHEERSTTHKAPRTKHAAFHLFHGDPFMPTENLKPACEEGVAFGIDLSLLIDNLRFSPEQRMERHDQALTTALALRQAMNEAPSTKHQPLISPPHA